MHSPSWCQFGVVRNQWHTKPDAHSCNFSNDHVKLCPAELKSDTSFTPAVSSDCFWQTVIIICKMPEKQKKVLETGCQLALPQTKITSDLSGNYWSHWSNLLQVHQCFTRGWGLCITPEMCASCLGLWGGKKKKKKSLSQTCFCLPVEQALA